MNSKLKGIMTERPRPNTGRASMKAASAAAGSFRVAGLDEDIPALSLSNLVYIENPYMYKECQ